MFRFFSNQAVSRKLIQISLDWTRPKDPPLSLGHASILANLKKHNIPVTAHAWSLSHSNFRHEEVRDFILQHADETTDVAFGAFVWNESAVTKILCDLKQHHFPGRIILGGPQISYVKKGLERYYPQADIFIRGYAEQALADLMLAKSKHASIQGVHFANTPDLGLSAKAELGDLPSPFLTGLIQPQPFIRFETQRGCPFRCSFCQHRESDEAMKRRQFTLSRAISEVNWITSHPIIQDIAVLDPTFNAGPHYLQILDQFIEGKYSGKLSLQCRIEMVTEDFLQRVRQLNKTGNVVLEFGLQTAIPQEQAAINRPNNLKKVREVYVAINRYNINTEISLIFGLPNQTVQSFQQSIDFCKSLQSPIVHAFPLMLLRGTPLFDDKEKYGLIESTDLVSNKIDRVQHDIPHVIASHSFTQKDWQQMVRMAEALEKHQISSRPAM